MDSHLNSFPATGLAQRTQISSQAPHLLTILLVVAVTLGACWTEAANPPKSPPPPVNIKVKTTPVSAEARAKWVSQTFLGDYDRVGRKDPKWDSAAREALTIMADIYLNPTNATPARTGKLSAVLQSAIDAGCDDPLIRYLHLRWGQSTFNLSTKERAERTDHIVQDVEHYSHIRLFFIALRASEMMDAAYLEARDTNLWNRATRLQAMAAGQLAKVLADPDAPSQEAISATGEFLNTFKNRKSLLDHYYPLILRPVFEHWANDPIVRQQEGWFFRQYAWAARGNGMADTVTEAKGQLFEERLLRCKAAYRKAWELDPTDDRIPTAMIDALTGLEEDRKEMELWFRRAMKLDPNNYDACKKKLWYLDPRWYGSDEDLIAFGKECVASDKWGGEVPLILADAHRAIQNYHFYKEPARSEYYRRPGVWADIKKSFERFFQINPQDQSHHHNYAVVAYRCQQWGELDRQLSLLGTTNYSMFGGTESFAKMVKDLQAHLPEKK